MTYPNLENGSNHKPQHDMGKWFTKPHVHRQERRAEMNAIMCAESVVVVHFFSDMDIHGGPLRVMQV